jgi:hypothetical protein
VIEWARTNGAPWDWRTCAFAALGGHLDIIRWAFARGAPLNEWTSVHAAGKGHKAILDWLHEQSLAWDRAKCVAAARRNGHDELAAWIELQRLGP